MLFRVPEESSFLDGKRMAPRAEQSRTSGFQEEELVTMPNTA